MKDSLLKKLESITERLQELDALLADPSIISDQKKFRDLSREYAEIRPVVNCFIDYQQNRSNIISAREMLEDSDKEMRALAEEELHAVEQKNETLEQELQRLLLPRDPADHSNIYLEIRAGTGGEEAALF
ncbi:MAG: PCRF domain-containing protein, partial [Gammaproteobacteria bacterium]